MNYMKKLIEYRRKQCDGDEFDKMLESGLIVLRALHRPNLIASIYDCDMAGSTVVYDIDKNTGEVEIATHLW